MSTMEYHYQTMGRILSHLVGAGLSRVDFDDTDAMDIMTHRIGDEEDVLKTFADVLHWLNDEGLIRVKSIQEFDGGYAFHGIQLTSKGISSAFVEATVNAVISKRFAKKQQMQWSRTGAHLLLQTRTQTLDGSLRSTFEKWYPGMANDNHDPADKQAAA